MQIGVFDRRKQTHLDGTGHPPLSGPFFVCGAQQDRDKSKMFRGKSNFCHKIPEKIQKKNSLHQRSQKVVNEMFVASVLFSTVNLEIQGRSTIFEKVVKTMWRSTRGPRQIKEVKILSQNTGKDSEEK
jgi:hypothetical protein